MTGRDPARLLRHRGPALLVATVEAVDDRTVVCAARDDGAWPWPRLLEGAAQAAGLAAGLHHGLANTAVIAEYAEVRLHALHHQGTVRFEARLDRRVLGFRRCRVAARDADGRPLVEGVVTLAQAESVPAPC